MIAWLRARYAIWQQGRIWTAEVQLRAVRQQVLEDHQWLGHSPLAVQLCERYIAMLREDWYSRPHESVEQFRQRVGLDPHGSDGGED